MTKQWGGLEAETALTEPLPNDRTSLEDWREKLRNYLVRTITAGCKADQRLIMLLQAIDKKLDEIHTTEQTRLTQKSLRQTLWVSIASIAISAVVGIATITQVGLEAKQMKLEERRLEAEIRPQLELTLSKNITTVTNIGKQAAYHIIPVIEWIDASSTFQVTKGKERFPLGPGESAPINFLKELPSEPKDQSIILVRIHFTRAAEDTTSWTFMPYAGNYLFGYNDRQFALINGPTEADTASESTDSPHTEKQ